MNQGWIKLQREFLHDELWLSEKFSKGQAWVDMQALANHSEGFIVSNGLRIGLKRGQLGWSEVKLSERWKWSRNKVRRFLGVLEMRGYLKQQKDKRSSIITIVDYDILQGVNAINDTETEQQKDNRRYTNKNNKNEKKKIINNSISSSDDDLQIDLIPDESIEKPINPVTEVFEYWKHRMGKTNSAKLTTERQKAVKARLKEGYTTEQLKLAVDGCASSEWHMGHNPQGVVYDELARICSKGSKVEEFIKRFEDVRSGAMDSRKRHVTEEMRRGTHQQTHEERFEEIDEDYDRWFGQGEGSFDFDIQSDTVSMPDVQANPY